MQVLLEVHGCATTQAEGSTLAALLRDAGHDVTADPAQGADADAAVLVTCTVVDRTERTMVKRLRELATQHATVIASGCMASAQPEVLLDAVPHALVLPPQQLDQVVPLLEEGRFTPAPVEDKAGLPRTVDGGVASIVINDGCLGNCTFCITKLARPGLRSYPVESIVDAIAGVVAEGAVEVRLTSMDTGAWGQDLRSNVADLIRAAREVPGPHRIRLGMLNPFLGLPFLEDLLDAMDHERVFRFLHVPVQSGSDRVLNDMGRLHAADDLRRIARAARDRLGEVSLSTDVIVGYPGSTEEDHEATMELLGDVRPAHVNVTRFSPRPGTAAARLPRLPGAVVKRRSREMSALRDEFQEAWYARLVGTEVEAVVTEHPRRGSSQARTANYEAVLVDGDLPIGTRVSGTVDWSGRTGAHLARQLISTT